MRLSITWRRKRPAFCTERVRDAKRNLRGKNGGRSLLLQKKSCPVRTRVNPGAGFFYVCLIVDDADPPDLRVLRSLNRQTDPHVFADIVNVGLGDPFPRKENGDAGGI